MPTSRRGSGGRGGRHGGGRGGLPLAVEPREVDEATKTCATADRMVFPPGLSPPRSALSGRADHDPYRNQPSRGSVGGHFGPLASRSGAEPSGRADHADHDPYRNQPSRGSAGGRTGPLPSRSGAEPVPCQDHVALPLSAQPAVSYLEKLLCNITPKESSVAATSSPISVRKPSDWCRDHADLPPSAQTLEKLLGKTTLKESSVPAIASPILVRKPPDWYFTFYIRTGLLGSFHTYPSLDGPFDSLQKADDAINRHLLGLTVPEMSKDSLDKLSMRERAVRKALYFPDGTRKKCLEPLDETLDEIDLLVRALVDQYNDDHNLLGNRALQLKDIQQERFFFSRGDLYHHFNFTAKSKGVVDSFFAEVKCTQGEDKEMVARCICVLTPSDDGLCHGCRNNGAINMKHPKKADAYCRGLVHEYMPSLGGYHTEQRFESVEAEEERLRYQFECFDDPRFMAEHFPNCVKTTVKT